MRKTPHHLARFGHIIFGVEDKTFAPLGLPENVHLDTTEIYKLLHKYTEAVNFMVAEYELERSEWSGKRRFGILYIAEASILVLPRIQVAYQEEENRSPRILINEGDIFVRRGAQSIKADQHTIYRLLKQESHPNEPDQQVAVETDTVAILIDGENMLPRSIDQIFTEAEKFGNVTIKRIFGKDITFTIWRSAITRYGIDSMLTVSSGRLKNGSDIALSVNAMELVQTGACKRLCIVSSDSDYVPLVIRLRAKGCQVFGIGGRNTPAALVQAYDKFVFIDNAPSGAFTSSPSTTSTATVPMPSKATVLNPTILTDAYRDAARGKEGEWVSLPSLGSSLKKLSPDFKVNDYAKNLTTLIKGYPNLFEFITHSNGNLSVRCKLHLELPEGR